MARLVRSGVWCLAFQLRRELVGNSAIQAENSGNCAENSATCQQILWGFPIPTCLWAALSESLSFRKMSAFGRCFRVTTFGESHCSGVGCIVEGVPPRMRLETSDIQPQLSRRRPGQSNLTTPRKESDQVQIMAGVEVGYDAGSVAFLLTMSAARIYTGHTRVSVRR